MRDPLPGDGGRGFHRGTAGFVPERLTPELFPAALRSARIPESPDSGIVPPCDDGVASLHRSHPTRAGRLGTRHVACGSKKKGLECQPDAAIITAMSRNEAKFRLGEVVRHRLYPFRGVIFDVDPEFSSSQEWWLSIPEDVRPRKDQPFYHLLAENEATTYVAYVSEQNLLRDDSGPVNHPQVPELFGDFREGFYAVPDRRLN